MPTSLSLKDILGRPDAGPGVFPDNSDTRAVVEVRATGPIDRPVELARAFKRLGASLQEAHSALNDVVDGKTALLRIDLDKHASVSSMLGSFPVSASLPSDGRTARSA